MYPGDPARDVFVFDAVAGFRIVFHYLAGAAAALHIYLEEDGVLLASDSDTVLLYKTFDYYGVKYGVQESYQVGVVVVGYAATDDFVGDGAERRRLLLGLTLERGRSSFLDLGLQLFLPGLASTELRVVEEVLFGCVVVAAAGLTVAAAYIVGEFVAGLVDVECEFVWLTAVGAGVAAGYALVFLQGVHSAWVCVHLSTAGTGKPTVDSMDIVDSYSNREGESSMTSVSTPSVSATSFAPGDVDTDFILAAILPTRDLEMPRMAAISR